MDLRARGGRRRRSMRGARSITAVSVRMSAPPAFCACASRVQMLEVTAASCSAGRSASVLSSSTAPKPALVGVQFRGLQPDLRVIQVDQHQTAAVLVFEHLKSLLDHRSDPVGLGEGRSHVATRVRAKLLVLALDRDGQVLEAACHPLQSSEQARPACRQAVVLVHQLRRLLHHA